LNGRSGKTRPAGIGRRLAKCFEGHNPWVIDGIEIERQEYLDAELRRSIKEYRFRLVETLEEI